MSVLYKTRGKARGLITLTACLSGLFLALAQTSGAEQQSERREIAGPVRLHTLPDTAYHEAMSDLLRKARHRIDLSTFIFKTGPSPDNRPAELVRELGSASRRGVKVRVIMENSEKDQELSRINQETAQDLRRAGVAVIFDNPRQTSHAKLAVIDRRYCLVGSHNLTQSALKYNREFSLLIDSPALAEELLNYLDKIAAQ